MKFFFQNILLVLKKAITLHSLFRGNTPRRKARSLKCCSCNKESDYVLVEQSFRTLYQS